MTFNNLDALLKYIQNDIQDVLKTDVADEVKNTMSQAVQTSVYDVYSPLRYTRREYNGGLIDPYNFESSVKGNTLTVTNNTPLDNGRTDTFDLDEIIVFGYGRQPAPRDFYGETARILDITGNHVYALKQGLKNKGYNVK